jgi:hypothetical protein
MPSIKTMLTFLVSTMAVPGLMMVRGAVNPLPA